MAALYITMYVDFMCKLKHFHYNRIEWKNLKLRHEENYVDINKYLIYVP